MTASSAYQSTLKLESQPTLRAATAPYIEIGSGHRLFVRDWGSGPPVLLLAGWGMESRSWAEVMVNLTDSGFRAIAYDRRGHGGSTDPGAIDYDLLSDDLAAVMESLDLHDVTIVAHSGAGGEAIRYLSRYGAQRVARLVLVGATGPRMIAEQDGAPGIPRDFAEAAVARIRDDLPGWIEDNQRPFAPQADQRTLDWLTAMIFDTSRRALIDFQRVILETDLTAEASAIPVPVTIIHGDQDMSAPVDLTARRYAEIIPDADLVVYKGVAHGVMVTHAARLAADIAARGRAGRGKSKMAAT